MEKGYRVAVIGATGNVGGNVTRILDERKFPVESLHPVASKDSIGNSISFQKDFLRTTDIASVDFSKIDLAIFCAGEAVSQKYAEKAAQSGAVVIDKTSYFRMNPLVPLVIPEVNGDILKKGTQLGIISTPNCVATPLCMALKALMKVSQPKRVVVSTYQAVSGAGQKAISELYYQSRTVISDFGDITCEIFPKQIAFNVIPQIGGFDETGISGEESKISEELVKILQCDIKSAVTCVRVPVFIGHSMSVACEFESDISEEEVFDALEDFEGILTIDRKEDGVFITPLDAQGQDVVFISRIRKDPSVEHGLLFWVATDNLRKGAALNSVQIAERMIEIDPSLKIFKRKQA